MDVIDNYLAAWNETDPQRRRTLIDRTWTDDARYVDPLGVADGKEAIDATVAAVQEQFAGLTFQLGSPIDAHRDIARFTWELTSDESDPVVVGFDMAVLTEDGRIRTVHGFLDKVPA